MSVHPLDPRQVDAHTAMEREAEARAFRERLEAHDQDKVERAERLQAFVAGKPVADVWARDLFPILQELHFAALQKVMEEPEKAGWVYYCRALQQVVNQVAGNIELGHTAMQRIAERRFGKANVLPRRR